MGFGYLFIGYIFFLYPVNHYLLAPAALLMFFGLRRLAAYNDGYRMARNLLFPALVGGAFMLTLAILGQYGIVMPAENAVRRIVSMLLWAILLFFHAALLRGTADITEETGLLRLRTSAVRNLIFTSVYLLARCILELDFGRYSAVVYSRVMLAVMLLGLAVAILNLILIYGCYMRICLPGQETKIQREYDAMVDGLKKNLENKNAKKGDQ